MKKKIKNMLKPLIKFVMILFRVFKIKDNKIVFSAFSARTYGDNPKYIAEYINMKSSEYDLVFVLEHPSEYNIPRGIRTVKYNSIKYLFEMATAKYWIDNTRKQPHILKRKGQFYIQTWHGGLCLKKVEKDAEQSLDLEYIRTAKNDSKNIDILLTNSTWGRNQLEKCFWYNGKIEITGSARNDCLINKTISITDIKRKLKIDSQKKVLLYAPTFRRNKNVDVYNLDYEKLLKTLKTKYNSDWVILVKLHPNIKEKNINLPQNVINVSSYNDINELFIITDILITDYSSTVFDYALTYRPAFIYAIDVEDYNKDRDTYFDIKKLPFKFAENNSMLLENINTFSEEEYKKELMNFYKETGILEDGKACERIFEIICKVKEKAYDEN